MKKLTVVLSGLLASLFALPSMAALDTTGMVTSITGASTDVEAIAVAIFGVVAVMFAISKIRQLGKA